MVSIPENGTSLLEWKPFPEGVLGRNLASIRCSSQGLGAASVRSGRFGRCGRRAGGPHGACS